MKKILTIITVISSVLTLSSCKSNPETATQKDMIKYGEFICEVNIDGLQDFKLTMNKDYTYSLYIKDYDYTTKNTMKTYEGKWSHVITYEYKYDARISHVGFFNKTETAVLGIYLLEDYITSGSEDKKMLHYFGYEKSSGKGNLFSAYETERIDEKFLESHRGSAHAHTAKNPGPVELPGLDFESKEI